MVWVLKELFPANIHFPSTEMFVTENHCNRFYLSWIFLVSCRIIIFIYYLNWYEHFRLKSFSCKTNFYFWITLFSGIRSERSWTMKLSSLTIFCINYGIFRLCKSVLLLWEMPTISSAFFLFNHTRRLTFPPGPETTFNLALGCFVGILTSLEFWTSQVQVW